MSKREERLIKAFENCIEKGEYTSDYAITLIEDDKRYGWLSNEAKEEFYAWLDEYENPTVVEPIVEVAEPIEEVAEDVTETVADEVTEEVTE